MKKRRFKIWTLAAISFFLCITCIHPVYPDEIFLQHVATLMAIALLIYLTVKNNISNQAFLCFILLLMFHITGARWNYSDIPYNEWIQSITRFNIDQYFDFKRNQYDRLVHFMYGFLLIIPISEIYINWVRIPIRLSKHLAFLFVLSTSMIYELIEWMVAVFLSPDQADAYNGQQGDIWDAQKDMALAMLGAVLMILILRIWNKKTVTDKVS
jgi:putative membrane protein